MLNWNIIRTQLSCVQYCLIKIKNIIDRNVLSALSNVQEISMDLLTGKVPHSSRQNQGLRHPDQGQSPGESFEDQVSSSFYQMEFQFWSCKTRGPHYSFRHTPHLCNDFVLKRFCFQVCSATPIKMSQNSICVEYVMNTAIFFLQDVLNNNTMQQLTIHVHYLKKFGINKIFLK